MRWAEPTFRRFKQRVLSCRWRSDVDICRWLYHSYQSQHRPASWNEWQPDDVFNDGGTFYSESDFIDFSEADPFSDDGRY